MRFGVVGRGLEHPDPGKDTACLLEDGRVMTRGLEGVAVITCHDDEGDVTGL